MTIFLSSFAAVPLGGGGRIERVLFEFIVGERRPRSCPRLEVRIWCVPTPVRSAIYSNATRDANGDRLTAHRPQP